MATVKVTRAMAAAALREVDWTKVDAMTDADIARQVADNPDAGAILPDGAAAAARVRFVRKKTGLSQPDFAVRFGISVGTLRDWEQGRTTPDAPARAYLRVIEREPAAAIRALAAV